MGYYYPPRRGGSKENACVMSGGIGGRAKNIQVVFSAGAEGKKEPENTGPAAEQK